MNSFIFIGILIVGALAVVGAIGWVIYFIWMKLRYKTVPSNVALVITGPKLGDPEKETNIFQDDQGRYMKIIRGGGHLLRRFQTATPVPLTSFRLNLTTPEVVTQKGVPILAEAVAMIKVADSLEGIARYAEQFLGKNQKDIAVDVSEVLGANLRAILSKMTVEAINGDKEEFNKEVVKLAEPQMELMGFKITSLGLSELKDPPGSDYIANLGRARTAELRKNAEIAEATSERETKVHVAQMTEEVKREQYQREISIAESRKEKEINDAKIMAETEREKAKTEAAYDLERAEREIEVEKERLKVISQRKEEELRLQLLEREKQVDLEQKEVEVRKAQADADYYERVKSAEADAEAKEKAGRAEAEVIRIKSLAEVEAIERRAEALNKNKEVMMTEMVIDMLPEFAKAVASPLGNVESIRILDGGKGEGGVGSLPFMVTNTMTNLQESLGQMTGINLEEIISNFSGKNNFKGELSEIASAISTPQAAVTEEVIEDVEED